MSASDRTGDWVMVAFAVATFFHAVASAHGLAAAASATAFVLLAALRLRVVLDSRAGRGHRS